MAKEVVTLYIGDTGLKLLVAKGKRVKKWGELPLESAFVRDGVIADEAKVAAKINELLKAQKIKAKKVIAGLSGLHCLSRSITLPRLPNEMLDEAVRREAERVLPVPLENFYLSWQTIPAPGEEIQVFLVAIPRNATDALIETLRQIGIKPYLIDVAPLALARVANRATAIIVDVRSTEFDIVIMVDGIPQATRSLSLPSEAVSWPEKLPIIKEDLDRTIKFYNSSNPEKPLDPSTPIFVSGELTQEPELCQSLSDELGYPVLPLPSPLDCPENFAPNQYMVNIGLALKELSPGKWVNPSAVNLNLLPEAYQPKPISLTKVLIVPGIVVAMALLVYMVTLTQGAAAGTAALRTQLNTINQILIEKQTQEQAQMEEITELEKQIAEIEASRDTFDAAINNFSQQRDEVNGDLALAIHVLPGSVTLSSITQEYDVLTISGVAPSEDVVLSYATKLRASDRFSQVVVSIIEKTCAGMNFTLDLEHGG